jgi:hypothetical protein
MPKIRLKTSIAGDVNGAPGDVLDVSENLARGLIAADGAELVETREAPPAPAVETRETRARKPRERRA